MSSEIEGNEWHLEALLLNDENDKWWKICIFQGEWQKAGNETTNIKTLCICQNTVTDCC